MNSVYNPTRRGLLGMFAAGVGAAILPSKVLMPVKSILLPPTLYRGELCTYEGMKIILSGPNDFDYGSFSESLYRKIRNSYELQGTFIYADFAKSLY